MIVIVNDIKCLDVEHVGRATHPQWRRASRSINDTDSSLLPEPIFPLISSIWLRLDRLTACATEDYKRRAKAKLPRR